MSVDVLQDKIRKTKNPTVLELTMDLQGLPPQFSQDAAGYGSYCRELLKGLKGLVPAVRLSMGAFCMLGEDGLCQLRETLKKADQLGYYVFLDGPELLSPMAAKTTAGAVFGENSLYPCDGLVIGGYLGSDILKPFLPHCKQGKKNLFVVARTTNKSAPEIQDLLSGGRLVHEVAADYVNRFASDSIGKKGYAQVGILAAASSADSLRSLRKKYPKLFFLLDGYDYPNSSGKTCSLAFDQFGHGAAVCGGVSITCAWKRAQSDGSDYLAHAQAAAERMKKNIGRYVTIL